MFGRRRVCVWVFTVAASPFPVGQKELQFENKVRKSSTVRGLRSGMKRGHRDARHQAGQCRWGTECSWQAPCNCTATGHLRTDMLWTYVCRCIVGPCLDLGRHQAASVWAVQYRSVRLPGAISGDAGIKKRGGGGVVPRDTFLGHRLMGSTDERRLVSRGAGRRQRHGMQAARLGEDAAGRGIRYGGAERAGEDVRRVCREITARATNC